MLLGIFKRFLGDNNEKEIKRMRAIVDQINSYEEELTELSDSSLVKHTEKFKERHAFLKSETSRLDRLKSKLSKATDSWNYDRSRY